jgi:hypothetical protein
MSRWLAIALSIALCSCASMPAPTAQQLDSIRSIDVMVTVPKRNFNASYGASNHVVMPAGGVSPGAAAGIGLAANLISLGIDHAALATAREADKPVSATIDDIDLRTTVFQQLKSLLPTQRQAGLTLSTGALPKLEDGQPLDAPIKKFAAQSNADATLFLSVMPQFRTQNAADPHVYASAWLISRSGQTLMQMSFQFAGPQAPDLEREKVVKWWADGRYRRFLLQGVRGVMTPLADALGAKPGYGEQMQALRAKIDRQPVEVTAASLAMRSSHCAVSADGAPLVLRSERMWQRTALAAFCPSDKDAQLAPGTDPDLVSIVTVGDAAAIAVRRETAKAESATSR